jgi:DNA-binding GntR family transcriptional regulator
MIQLKTMHQAVTEAIRDMILRGNIAPGEKIEQQEIAELLNVSRMPVREALRVLEAEDLVSIYPHRGAYVAKLSPNEIKDIFAIRATLEGIAGRNAVPKLTDRALERMRNAHQMMRLADGNDEWVKLNEVFHMTLYKAAGRMRLLDLITSLRHTVRPYIMMYISLDRHIESAGAQHEAILHACEHNNEHLVEEEIQTHLKTTCREVLAQMASEEEPARTETA